LKGLWFSDVCKNEGVLLIEVLIGSDYIWSFQHESLKDAIEFNGVRYSVELPCKRAHKPLPSNYDNSLKRLNGQFRRLRQQPEILKEYDKIINEQLQQGIIEPVVELERPGERVH
jgi:hypothetical protein